MAEVAFRSTREVILRTPAWRAATSFYASVLALPVAYESATMLGFETGSFRLYVEAGSAHAPVFELLVADFDAARERLLAAGCTILEEVAEQPRCYLRDPFGFTFNLGRAAAAPARPDPGERPFRLETTRGMAATPRALYEAFTLGLERWFAAPGTLAMNPVVGAPFYWETEHEGRRHPHYGRFLALERDRRLEFTWLTSATGGAETVVTVTLDAVGPGTSLTLAQAGFADEAAKERHAAAWPHVLAHLDATLGQG